jgi:hypothetical protein
MPLGHIWRIGSGTGCDVAMGSTASGVYIGSFGFSPFSDVPCSLRSPKHIGVIQIKELRTRLSFSKHSFLHQNLDVGINSLKN